jgi:hypothetical protein
MSVLNLLYRIVTTKKRREEDAAWRARYDAWFEQHVASGAADRYMAQLREQRDWMMTVLKAPPQD